MKFVGSKGGAGVWQRIISEMPPHATLHRPRPRRSRGRPRRLRPPGGRRAPMAGLVRRAPASHRARQGGLALGWFPG